MDWIKYERKWWSADILEHWNVVDDRGKVTFDFTDQESACHIEVNATKKVYGYAESDDLLSFMSEVERDSRKDVLFEESGLVGYVTSLETNSGSVWKWYLFRHQYIFFITVELKGAPNSSLRDVESFIHSIKLAL